MLQTNISSNTILLRQVKVRTLQYKVTIFLVALLLFAFWPQISRTYNAFQASKQSLDSTKLAHEQKKLEHATILKDVTLLQKIAQEAQRNILIQCYNTNCTSLPDDIKAEPQKSIVKAYLQLQQDTETKFTIDQKKLLAYLNEFLVKNADGTTTQNSVIKGITFGAPSVNEAMNIKEVPMSVSISFPNKDALLGFLRNIEQYISPTFPMLAVAQSVTYDLVKSNEAQEVNISLNIYMLE